MTDTTPATIQEKKALQIATLFLAECAEAEKQIGGPPNAIRDIAIAEILTRIFGRPVRIECHVIAEEPRR